MKIDVDLEVFKSLTARLEHEHQTLNDVVREILDLPSLVEPISVADEHRQLALENLSVANRSAEGVGWGQGFYSRGLLLPNGTALRARYKGLEYRGKIEADAWIDHAGNRQFSPTAAAKTITGNSVNGWRFWEAWRPGDAKWRRLDLFELPK
jgi:hypothetical protein